MKTPNPRLRPLFNNSKSTARVELFIPAGAEIAVDDERRVTRGDQGDAAAGGRAA